MGTNDALIKPKVVMSSGTDPPVAFVGDGDAVVGELSQAVVMGDGRVDAASVASLPVQRRGTSLLVMARKVTADELVTAVN